MKNFLRYVQKALDDMRWSTHTTMCWRVVLFLRSLLKVELSLLPSSPTSTTMEEFVRSPEALRPLTLCNCDCKILTLAICRGLQWYTKRCIHPSHRCISSRQMTDNIFENETTALAHVACAPRESGILFTDFAAAYPSFNHSWIFHVLEQTELLEFICRFLRRIYYDSTTRGLETRLSCERLLVCDGFRLYRSMASRSDHSKESCCPGFLATCPMCLR